LNLNKLKSDLEKVKRKLAENPNLPFDEQMEMLNSVGFELGNISEEELKSKLMKFASDIETLKDDVLTLQNIILNNENKNSKAINQYHNHLKGKQLTSEEKEKIQKLFSRYVTSEIEESGKSCFHFDQRNCDFIIKAHSLQKGGVLKNISKNHKVYKISNDSKRTPSLLSTSNASTFQGFCHSHDAIFQQTIESYSFDESPEHCFLHSYRSFAYSYHKIKEEQDFYEKLIKSTLNALKSFSSNLQTKIDELGLSKMIDLSGLVIPQISQEQLDSLKIVRYETYRTLLNNQLKNKRYTELEYLVYHVDHKIPFACASWIKSHLHLNNYVVIEKSDTPYHGYPLIVTILPDQRSTVVLARFKSDNISKLLFRDLEKERSQNTELFQRKLSSIILRLIDNIYFSPEFWDSQDSYVKEAFIKEMKPPTEDFINILEFDGPVNIFSEIYSLKN
jgi:hypothetical protein